MMTKFGNSPILCKGRFMIDAQPVPSALARSGNIYRWIVQDFDEELEYSGLADSLSTSRLMALSVVKELRGMANG